MGIPEHYHMCCKSRGNEQNAVAHASYIRGLNLYCEEDHKIKTFGNRIDTVLHSEIVLPQGAPEVFRDPQVLWNSVQKNETRKDARFCYSVTAALAFDVSDEGNIQTCRNHALLLSQKYGVVVDFSVHKAPEGSKNTHAHFMFTTRALTQDGWAKRQVSAFRGKSGAFVKMMRVAWQEHVNAILAEEGITDEYGQNLRIDMRSFAERGIDRLPQIHQGVRARAMERKGIKPISKTVTEQNGRQIRYPDIDKGKTRSEYNAEIIAINERFDYVERHQNIDDQLLEAERKIEIHLDSLDELSKELALGILPEHLRAKFMAALLRLKRLQFLKLFELIARERKKRKEKKRRIQEHMREARRRLLELETKKEQMRAVKKLYAHIYSYCFASASLAHHYKLAGPHIRFVTRAEHKVIFKAKAESYRDKVTPEYRPALKIKVANHKPIDNGGKARPPPMIRNRFNEAARVEKYKAMNESLIWLENRNPERPNSKIEEIQKEFLENAIDKFILSKPLTFT